MMSKRLSAVVRTVASRYFNTSNNTVARFAQGPAPHVASSFEHRSFGLFALALGLGTSVTAIKAVSGFGQRRKKEDIPPALPVPKPKEIITISIGSFLVLVLLWMQIGFWLGWLLNWLLDGSR